MGKLSQEQLWYPVRKPSHTTTAVGGGDQEVCFLPPLFSMLSDLCVGAHGTMIYEQLNGVCVSLESNLGWAL